MRFRAVLILAMLFAFAGCIVVETLPPEPVPVPSPGPTVYDLDSAAQALIGKMLSHPEFVRNYNAAKDEKGTLPVLCLGLLENKLTTKEQTTTGVDVRPRLRAVDDTIRVALFDTGLFEIQDDKSVEAIQARIGMGTDVWGENTKDLLALFGERERPDFIVLGDLRHFEDVGGCHTYKLHLAIHSLKTFKIVWEGIQTKVKL